MSNWIKATLLIALFVLAFYPPVSVLACRLLLQPNRVRIRCVAPRAASQELTYRYYFCFPLQPAPALVAFLSLRIALQQASMSSRFFRFLEFALVISAFLRSIRLSLLSNFPLLSPKAEPQQQSSCLHY